MLSTFFISTIIVGTGPRSISSQSFTNIRKQQGVLFLRVFIVGVWLGMLTLITGSMIQAQAYDDKKVVRKAIKRPAKTTVLRNEKKCSHRAGRFKMVKRQTADRKQKPPPSGKQGIPTTPDNTQTNVNNATPSSSDIKRAGEFKGDLRDIPSTKPTKEYRPKLTDPKVNPKPYVKTTVIKQN